LGHVPLEHIGTQRALPPRICPFSAPPPPPPYTLSLHDALPIYLTASRLQAHWPITSNATNDDDTELALPKSILKWLPQHTDLPRDRKSTRLNSSHVSISYAVF